MNGISSEDMNIMKKEFLVYKEEQKRLKSEMVEIGKNIERAKLEMEVIKEEQGLSGMDIEMTEENKESIFNLFRVLSAIERVVWHIEGVYGWRNE